jgi:hypothetical protein
MFLFQLFAFLLRSSFKVFGPLFSALIDDLNEKTDQQARRLPNYEALQALKDRVLNGLIALCVLGMLIALVAAKCDGQF